MARSESTLRTDSLLSAFITEQWVRSHFSETLDEARVFCKHCKHVVTSYNGSVTAMEKHLKSYQHLSYATDATRRQLRTGVPSDKQWYIAALSTVLHVPFRAFSHPLLQVILARADIGAVNRDLASRSVDNEFTRVREILKLELQEMKRNGVVFAVVVDEWTTARKR